MAQSKVLPSGSRAPYFEELEVHGAHYPLDMLPMSANLIRNLAPTVHTPNTGPPHLISTQDEPFSLPFTPHWPFYCSLPLRDWAEEGSSIVR